MEIDEKKGFYFSFDALVALTVLSLAMVIIVNPSPSPLQSSDSRISDTLRGDAVAESSMQVAMRQPVTKTLSDSEVSYYQDNTALNDEDLNGSVMDAVATLWASDDTEEARNLSETYFSRVIPEGYDYRLVMADDKRNVVYNTSHLPEDVEFLTRSSRIVSGVARDRPTRGFIASASLSEATKQETKNVYYGGYVGDGNITSNVTLPDLHTVLNVSFEGDFSGPFDLYFNEQYAGHYEPGASNLSADVFHICSKEQNASVCNALNPGDNLAHINFTSSNRSIGGGFLSIDYNRTTDLEERGGEYLQRKKNLHGVNQIINIFSSIYVPENLEEMGGALHYSTEYNRTLFVQVGNATIYENKTSGEVYTELNETRVEQDLEDAGLDYDKLSEKTVPLRISFRDIEHLGGRNAIADSVSVIDVSGSMDGSPLEEAKDASQAFTNIILNASTNRAGLVAYDSVIDTVHRLTSDAASLNQTIEGLSAGGNTCIGCGILEGTETVTEPSYRKIITARSEWKWNASYPDSSPPEKNGKQWYEPGYDADWEIDNAVLGFGPEADTTLPDNGGDYFFRKEFEYSRQDYSDFKAFVRSDNAADIYLNGELVDNDTGEHEGEYWNHILNGLNPVFTDSFERSGLGTDWDPAAGTEGDEVVVDDTCGASEGTEAMVLRWGGVAVESRDLDLSGRENISLEYDLKQGGSGACETPEDGEDVNVQYLDSGGNWNTLKTHPGGGTDPSNGVWNGYRFELPQDALHSGFKIRFEYPSASGSDYDYWAADGVRIGENHSVGSDVLQSGTNVVAARLKNDGETERRDWVTDETSEWNEGTFNNTTVKNGDLTLEPTSDLSPSDVDATNYCSVSGGDTSYGMYIDNVNIRGIDRTTGNNDGYVDATDSITNQLIPGESYAIEATLYTYESFFGSYPQYASVVFDWDNDTDLTDNQVYEIGSCSTDGCTVSTTITIPDTATPGSTLMRVMGEYDNYHKSPCSNPDYNEIEDYSAFVKDAEYVPNGSYRSKTIETSSPVDWSNYALTADIPTETDVESDFTNTTHWFDTIQDVPDSRYLGFNLSLGTTDVKVAPSVDKVNISYQGNEVGFDFALNGTEERKRSMIVMSDGEANVETSMEDVPDHDDDGDTTDDPQDHAIEAACRAQEDHDITVYTVGFGSGADNDTLNATAECGDGEYYYSSTGELEEVFANISEDIFQASFIGQTVELEGGEGLGTLYPDSFIDMNYTSERDSSRTFDLLQLSPRFGGNVSSPKNGSFDVPEGVTVKDARSTSYSSNYWTDRLLIQNSTGEWENVYRLWRYGEDYRDLGDPFQIRIPPAKIDSGTNNVSLDTGLNRTERRGGSPDSRVIYTLAVEGSVGYGSAFSKSEGGNYTFQTVNGPVTLQVGNISDEFNASNDALDNATARLVNQLDADNDGVVDFQLDSEDLQIDRQNVGGIRWLWGPATASLEVWRSG